MTVELTLGSGIGTHYRKLWRFHGFFRDNLVHPPSAPPQAQRGMGVKETTAAFGSGHPLCWTK